MPRGRVGRTEAPPFQICRCCKIEKPIDEYGNNAGYKDGKQRKCFECVRAVSRVYNETNKEKMRVAHTKWVNENREYVRAYQRHCWKPDPDFKFKGDVFNGKPVEREHVLKPRDKEAIKRKQRETKHLRREKSRLSMKRRLQNPSARLLHNLRGQLSSAIKNVRAKKYHHTLDLLGCSLSEFEKWIESHWLINMSWENYGRERDQWSIDHHFPCTSFDLFDEKEQRKCFHHTNLYPMWHLDNIRKNNTVPSSPKTDQQKAFLKSHE